MSVSLAPSPRWRAYFNGQLANDGKVYTYAAGTSTPKATYKDAAGIFPNTNPVELDAEGKAIIYWDTTANYDIRVESKTGQLIYTQDNYSPA